MRRYQSEVYPGQSFTMQHGGRAFRVSIEWDDTADAPWDQSDGNVSIECKPGGYGSRYGSNKRPGEVVIFDSGRHGFAYVVDIPAAMAEALRDKWGIAPELRAEFERKNGRPPTRREVARMAIDENIVYLRAWCADDWTYVGVIVQMIGADGEPVGDDASLWGVESFGTYARDDVAPELAEELIRPRREAWREELKSARRLRELSRLAEVMAAPIKG